MNVLVTGAAGYIGSRVVYELQKAYTVVGIDNFYKGSFDTFENIQIIRADIRDKSGIEKLLPVDCIVHLAAISGVEPCSTNKELSYDVNVNGTRILAYICKKHGIPLIFATSFGIMGDPQYFPIDEQHPRNPIHWYGQTKYQGEKIVTKAAQNFPCYLLIKSNVYGIHSIGGIPVFKPTVVNQFAAKAKSNNTLHIYSPGTQARNFLHVKDAAHAYRLAVDTIVKAEPGVESYCIASPESISINDLAKKVVSIAEEYGYSPSVDMVENPRTETLVTDFSVDISKAQKELQFSPGYTIERAVQEMLENALPEAKNK
ncbi:MAG: NAD(P)-dependent oxidoreductase [Candidatus Methanofastidiosia archaeon]